MFATIKTHKHFFLSTVVLLSALFLLPATIFTFLRDFSTADKAIENAQSLFRFSIFKIP